MIYLCIKWIWKPQNGYKWPLMPIRYSNKKESCPFRTTLYKVLGLS